MVPFVATFAVLKGLNTGFLNTHVNKQIHEIKQIGFCMECFTADFLRVFNKNVKIWLLGVRLGTRHQIQAFLELS